MILGKKPLFKIDYDSVIKGSGDGHLYVRTIPEHPHGEKRGDRDARYVYLHRAVMELHLGRYLKKGEEVHHKDENPKNNNISNLLLTTKTEHPAIHAPDKKFWKESPRTKPGRKRKALRIVSEFIK